MLDLRAVRGDPCTTCRIIAIITMSSILPLFHYHGLKEIDFFGLRHYVSYHIPPVVDVILTFVLIASIWIVCERVVVARFMRKR